MEGKEAETKRAVGKIAVGKATGCEDCDSCMPCGYGVDIPGTLRYFDAAVSGGGLPAVPPPGERNRPMSPHAEEFLRGYDRAVADRHQAHRCVRCFHCALECPLHIFIVNELDSAARLLDDLRDWRCQAR